MLKRKDGKSEFRLEGKFTESLSLIDMGTNEVKEMWHVAEKPLKHDWMYHFTRHTLQMNALSEALKQRLPHTDSRLRPD